MGKGKKRKNRNKGGGGQRSPSTNQGNEKGVRNNYETISKENEKFEAYFKLQKICEEEEWDDFMRHCRENLPVSFRVTGSRTEAMALHHILENQLLKDVIEVGKGEHQLDVQPFALPWYPNRMAWQLNLSRKDIRSNEAFLRFHNFLIAETESGNISRQEAVSMIPPLVLDVQPHHKVLDMCASPGSKTAQIIEMLHANDDKNPEGYVVANDVDNRRCYMLVHQGKRLQSPAFIVTNADAVVYPRLMITGPDGEPVPLKFDRVLCDVPCSGDGTVRKNVDVWKKWNPINSFHLHQVQFQILKRGMKLLDIGGQLVYSTCSMNPLEDEAVVHRMLQEAKGAVELKQINLPHLKHKNGLSHWTICNKDLEVYSKAEDVPEKWQTTIRPTIINVGVKALSRIDNKWSPCNFRLSQEGLPALCPHIKARRVEVTKPDLMLMIQQSEEEKAPLVETFAPSTQAAILKLERGSIVVICNFKVNDNGPDCYLELVGWKGATSLRVYVQKHDRTHYLRLCGMSTSKYEINKFKDKAEKESETKLVVEENNKHEIEIENLDTKDTKVEDLS